MDRSRERCILFAARSAEAAWHLNRSSSSHISLAAIKAAILQSRRAEQWYFRTRRLAVGRGEFDYGRSPVGTRKFLMPSFGWRSAVDRWPGDILAPNFETILMAVMLDHRGALCHCEQLATA